MTSTSLAKLVGGGTGWAKIEHGLQVALNRFANGMVTILGSDGVCPCVCRARERTGKNACATFILVFQKTNDATGLI
jgi:hypothetical protein